MSSNAQNGLPPAVKEWLDRVLVPALTQKYLSQLEREHITCNGAEGSAESAAESPAKIEAEGGTT